MKLKKTNEDRINDFLTYWDCEKNTAFLRDIGPLLELYDVDESDDWVKNEVGEDNERNVRLVRTVYLMSRLADLHAGEFVAIKCQFKGLWKRLESDVV